MNRGTHLYPESTTLITEIEATGVQLKPETECSIALKHRPTFVINDSSNHFLLSRQMPRVVDLVDYQKF